MKSLSKFIAALAILPVFAVAAPVMADSPGQLAGGSNVYVVKNLTQKGSYSASISASACDEVQYSVYLHNLEFGALNNVTVNATLSGNTSTVTAVPDSGANAGTTGSVTVNLPSGQNLSYENGSTTLFDGSGNVIKTLPDTITSSGVNVGTIIGSTTEFVNFKAKVSCPPVPTPTPTPTPVKPTVVTTTKALPNTGPGDVAGLFVGTSVFGTIGHYLFRRNRR